MITEDYISFETAKLLKEKGFDKDFDADIVKWYNVDGEDENLCSLVDFRIYKCPSLAMSMKWLREVHNFHIWVEPNHDEKGLYNAHVKVGWWSNNWAGVGYNTYEAACEAAIKYCLENLI